MERSDFDRHAKKYEFWYDDKHAVYESESEMIRKLLPVSIAKNSIEIGVGTGRFAATLGFNYGLDPSENMMNIASMRRVECIKGVAEALPIKSSSMENVLIVTSLCFMDVGRAFEEMHRILVPSGYLIIAFVDRNSALGKEYNKKTAEESFCWNAKFYSTEELLLMLEEHGFEDTAIRQTLFSSLDSISKPEISEEGFGKGSFIGIRARSIKHE